MIHKLMIGGEDWSGHLLSASVAFRGGDAGSSGMEFEVLGFLAEYVNAPVQFFLGEHPNYMKLYFSGTLYTPKEHDKLPTSTASAFGPFRTMMDLELGSNETYVGKTLEWVVMDCAERAETLAGEIVVINGGQYRVKQGESFPFDNKIGDVLNTLMGKANFVGTDQPGGRRLFMPKPVPGSNTNFKRTYSPDQYTEFGLTPKAERSFRKVVVYRNGSNGQPEVYAEREVHSKLRFRPRRNAMFVVSDFPGTGQEAQDECYRLAEEIRNGVYGFSLNTFFDPNLKVYDGFKAVQVKSGTEKTFACFLDEGIDIDYSPGSPAMMSLSGMAHELKRERRQIVETRKFFSYSGIVRTNIPPKDLPIEDKVAYDDSIVLGGTSEYIFGLVVQEHLIPTEDLIL